MNAKEIASRLIDAADAKARERQEKAGCAVPVGLNSNQVLALIEALAEKLPKIIEEIVDEKFDVES